MELSHEKLMEWAKQEFDKLEKQYAEIEARYSEYTEIENKGREYKDLSVIHIKVRRRSPYAINAIWHWTRFFKSKEGKWIPRTSDINKGRGLRTPRDRIARRAKKWEIDEAWKAELELAKLRGKQKELGYIVASFRRLKKIEDEIGNTTDETE